MSGSLCVCPALSLAPWTSSRIPAFFKVQALCSLSGPTHPSTLSFSCLPCQAHGTPVIATANPHHCIYVCNELEICLSPRWDLNPGLSLAQRIAKRTRYQSAKGELALSQGQRRSFLNLNLRFTSLGSDVMVT